MCQDFLHTQELIFCTLLKNNTRIGWHKHSARNFSAARVVSVPTASRVSARLSPHRPKVRVTVVAHRASLRHARTPPQAGRRAHQRSNLAAHWVAPRHVPAARVQTLPGQRRLCVSFMPSGSGHAPTFNTHTPARIRPPAHPSLIYSLPVRNCASPFPNDQSSSAFSVIEITTSDGAMPQCSCNAAQSPA